MKFNEYKIWELSGGETKTTTPIKMKPLENINALDLVYAIEIAQEKYPNKHLRVAEIKGNLVVEFPASKEKMTDEQKKEMRKALIKAKD